MPQKTLVLDSTQLEAFDTCPQLWEYAHHEHLVTINSDEKGIDSPINCGTFAHKLLEEFYYYKAKWQRLKDQNLSDSTKFKTPLSLGIYMMDHWVPPDGYTDTSEAMQKKIRERLKLYWMTYAESDVTPAYDQVKQLDNDFNEYYIDGDPQVEKGFAYELLNTREYLFVLEGKIDLIFQEHGGGFLDHKTQLRARNLYKKSFQFRNYSLASGKRLGIINYIRLHDKVEKNTLQREIISFSPQEVHEWKEELTEIYINITKEMSKTQLTKHRSQCSGKFGYACAFADLCEQPDRDLKQRIRDNYFKIGKEWKPW